MYVLPCSHRFFANYRSGSYGIPTAVTDSKLRPFITDMIIPPASALVFHNSLFHASYPNDSGQNRISAIVSIYQRNAPLIYCHKNIPDNCTDIYGINSEIFLTSLNTLENGGVPANPLYQEKEPLNIVDNKLITSGVLLEEFKSFFSGAEKDFEPRQLHILKDKDIEMKMQRDGYAVLDFLDSETVNALKSEYEKQFDSANTSIGRFTPMEHSSPASKRAIHQFILEKIRPELERYFENYQTPIASYFVKYARSAGDLSWHTDTSLMINTHLEPHFGIWCPLIDVNEKNGAFCLIERSHKFSHAIFLGGIPWPYEAYHTVFDKVKKVTELKAGQIVLFDLRLIHHATPNDTDQDRIVFCVRLTHKKSKYYSFLCENEKEQMVSVYEEKPDYYLRDDWSGLNQVADKSHKAGEIQHLYSHINYPAIEEALQSAANIPEIVS
jgi:ectoine hydroxylase-related dioxygenase (phytanoyl-CoA dioxygenase family)